MQNNNYSIPCNPGTLHCRPSQSCRHARNIQCRLLHTITCLWAFLITEDLWEDAAEFLADHSDDPVLFELVPELTAFLDPESIWKE